MLLDTDLRLQLCIDDNYDDYSVFIVNLEVFVGYYRAVHYGILCSIAFHYSFCWSVSFWPSGRHYATYELRQAVI
jgi:hypothetical protein